MQGTAADIIKRAMISVDDWLQREQPQARLVMQVHDELVFELPENDVAAASGVIRTVMSGAAEPAVKLSVPLDVDIGTGQNWDEAH